MRLTGRHRLPSGLRPRPLLAHASTRLMATPEGLRARTTKEPLKNGWWMHPCRDEDLAILADEGVAMGDIVPGELISLADDEGNSVTVNVLGRNPRWVAGLEAATSSSGRPSHGVRAVAWPAALAPYWLHRLEQRNELGDLVAVAAGQAGGERDAVGVGDQVVPAARPAPVNRGLRPVFGPPLAPGVGAVHRSPRKVQSVRAAEPDEEGFVEPGPHAASVHSASRRQHVMPDPKPSSNGRCSQAMPVCSTNRMPWNTSRSGCRFRPG